MRPRWRFATRRPPAAARVASGARARGSANRLAAPWLDADRATAERALRALRCSNHEIRVDRPIWSSGGGSSASALRAALLARAHRPDGTLRRWAAADRAHDARPTCCVLAAARFAAERAAGRARARGASVRAAYRRAVRIAYRDPIELADLAVTGRDLMAAGVAPGPGLGIILHRLLEAVVEDPAENDRERLLARARALAADGPAGRVPARTRSDPVTPPARRASARVPDLAVGARLMLFRGRQPAPSVWRRFRSGTDDFTFAREGDHYEARVAANAERVVDLLHALSEHLPPAVDVAIEDVRAGRALAGVRRRAARRARGGGAAQGAARARTAASSSRSTRPTTSSR